MRKIKFRAWCETDYGDEIIYFGSQEFDNGLWFDSTKHINAYHSVMQFTGLTDKNGCGNFCLYDGDIVSLDGKIIGNIHETSKDIYEGNSYIVVPKIGTKDWRAAEQRLLDIGFGYSI